MHAGNVSSGLTQTGVSKRGEFECNRAPEVLWFAFLTLKGNAVAQRSEIHPERRPDPCCSGRRPAGRRRRRGEAGACATYPALSIDECGERRPDDYPEAAASASLAVCVPRAARHRSSARNPSGPGQASDGCHGHLPEATGWQWLQSWPGGAGASP